MTEATTRTHANRAPSPLVQRILRGIAVGFLSLMFFYLKLLGGIVKLGIRAVRKVPVEKSGD